MFTGIIEGMGILRAMQPMGLGRRLSIESDFGLEQTKIGDSIAVNGACLTAVSLNARRFEADVSPETLAKTTFGEIKVGDRVNLERALRLCDRLDGHLVSGHIDGTGTIEKREAVGNAIIVTIGVPESLSRYLIAKGSVAVDGISLTVNRCSRQFFEVSVIPHSARLTTIGFKKVNEPVNIETDMIGKYVERFVGQIRDQDTGQRIEASGVDLRLLAKNGFL